jgi:hypothetical protein
MQIDSAGGKSPCPGGLVRIRNNGFPARANTQPSSLTALFAELEEIQRPYGHCPHQSYLCPQMGQENSLAGVSPTTKLSPVEKESPRDFGPQSGRSRSSQSRLEISLKNLSHWRDIGISPRCGRTRCVTASECPSVSPPNDACPKVRSVVSSIRKRQLTGTSACQTVC